jgi:hypothetical protein
MKTKLIAALLVALSATAAAPAFASGYGPAPFYKPSVGAPASQRGQSEATLAAERDSASAGAAQQAYGGVVEGQSQSAGPAVLASRDNLFAHH